MLLEWNGAKIGFRVKRKKRRKRERESEKKLQDAKYKAAVWKVSTAGEMEEKY